MVLADAVALDRRPRLQVRALPAHPRGGAGLRPDLRLRALLLGRAAVPAGDAGDPRRGAEVDRYLVNPGDGRDAARRASTCSASDGAWDASDAFISVGFVAIIALFGLQHGFFQPQVARRRSWPSATSKPATTLSDEFEALGERIGKVGTLAGLIVVVTIFFMTSSHSCTRLTPARGQLDASLPIAMFDSGVGGLTVLHECLVSLPEEDFVYLGDTACSPTGPRTPSGCASGSAAIAELLLERGAKLLVIACNTATSIGADVAREVAAERGVEVVPVVEPQAEIAAAITDSGRVGVLATPNTVESGAYRRALEGAGPGARGDRGRGARPGALHPGRLALRRGRGGDGPRLLRAAEAGRGRHPDPRLHPLPAGRADAAAHPRPRRAPGQRRPRGRRRGPAHARAPPASPARPTARAPTASSAPATSTPSASSAPASCRCRSARSSGSTCADAADYP